ncbi:Immunity protein 50 [Micromonospora viridifaciens]|uniref:Immunity protein 50 n=1 Tax=Micromonospora viridifaciens TaxID=1881 RepID=A0A1C4YDR9_MICVI|nr:Imm50 family immunity protein [Micromonospora viridifaciens]SCF18481.1 Immunity protein 50 [Micromonospora viridifaciens]
MSGWVDLLSESHGIRAIYGEDLPALTSVDLHEFALHRDGPRATLRFDLPQFPKSPPKKWADQGFNVVQVQLTLVDVLHLAIVGWTTRAVLDINVERMGEVLSLRANNGPVDINIDARWLVLSHLSAYCRASAE